jgi:hypothetical protein
MNVAILYFPSGDVRLVRAKAHGPGQYLVTWSGATTTRMIVPGPIIKIIL